MITGHLVESDVETLAVLELARALADELWQHLATDETYESYTPCNANILLGHPLVADVQEANRKRYHESHK